MPPAAAALASLILAAPVAAQSTDPQPSITYVYREIGGESLHAYVFLPPGHRIAPRAHAILLFHGGGWSAGAAEWTFPTARRFADSGLVAIAIQLKGRAAKRHPRRPAESRRAARKRNESRVPHDSPWRLRRDLIRLLCCRGCAATGSQR